jgi:hypothetical protein
MLHVVIVNLKHDQAEAVRGVLWGSRGRWLELRDASLLRGRGDPQPLDGSVIVPRDNVSFIQVIP